MGSRFVLVGRNIGFSYSKVIHEFMLERYFEPGTYDLFDTPVYQLPKGYDGYNITMPYKQIAAESCETLGDSAEIGVVNTIDKYGYGYNTDIYGFRHISDGIMDQVGEVYIFGKGATSKMVQYLSQRKLKYTKVIGREGFSVSDIRTSMADQPCEETNCRRLLVNCTPVGVASSAITSVPQDFGFTESSFMHFDYFIDLVYNPLETEFMRLAKQTGTKCVGGIDMLVAQALEAELIWHETDINVLRKHDIIRETKEHIVGLIQAGLIGG